MVKEHKKTGTEILYAMIGEARQYDDAIIMGRGDPDFDTPEHIVAAAKEAMVQHAGDYVPPEGLLSLREAIAERVKRVNGVELDPATEIVVTNGGQEALFLMVAAVLGEGDEMIVPEPNYNTYHDAMKFAGAVKVDVNTYPDTDFRAAPEDVRKVITDKTKAMLLVSPNNPAASVISPEDVQAFIDIAQEHDLMIISDDIYDLFVYDDYTHTSFASLPGGKERTLTLNALSKAYSMTGWRTGWVSGPADLMARVRDLKAAVSGGTSIIAQYA
ncbi:MAG: pyridoxal phosphate-dependent aminotransferase, partial [Chloroflexota bacterium]